MLGGALFEHLAKGHRVVGTSRAEDRAGLVRIDALDRGALDRIVGEPWDLVVNCIGLVDREQAERTPELAWVLNAEVVDRIARAATGRFVHVSSDAVFEGCDQPIRVESTPPAPLSVYATTKLAGEELALNASSATVLRVPMMFGTTPWSTKFVTRCHRGERAYVNVSSNAVYIPSLLDAFWNLVQFDGVVHFGGRDRVTRHEVLTAVRAATGIHGPVPRLEVDTGAERRGSGHTELRSERHDLVGLPLGEATRHLRAGTSRGEALRGVA
jgi:dTDP-4-dehydrorhamnose reductase